MKRDKFINRELSWLSFNYRVLQEAKNPSVPLYDRINFLAIFSSNLDEFFRVRVASLRSLVGLKQKTQERLKFSPDKLLSDIHKTVLLQQIEFGLTFRNEILPQLRENDIHLLTCDDIEITDEPFIRDYFNDNVIQLIQPILLVKNKIIPFLKNRQLYHAIRLVAKKSSKVPAESKRVRHNYALVEIPTSHLPRFIELPQNNNTYRYIFLDDIVKYCLAELFPAYQIDGVYSVKLTRDAELYIDDEFTGNLLSKIKKNLNKRSTGAPSRFLFDEKIPEDFLKFLKETIKLGKDDLVAGAAYHNYSDFFSFPSPCKNKLRYSPLVPLSKKCLDQSTSVFDSIKKDDVFFYFPYHKYDYVIDFFEKSAEDPHVKQIKLTQYRVANNSKIVAALIKAARNGKEVIAFVEIKARFDEESNIKWAEEMERSGVKVYYSFPGLKVHAKLASVKREEDGRIINYCYLGTGNFNEKTATVYTDFGLLTSDIRLTNEVENVFDYLVGKANEFIFDHLLVAQFNMRENFLKLIDNEIQNARRGLPARIILKMNSLEDRKMINKLYAANKAGVIIDIIVRGVCCLNPGIEGLSENIKVISIVDKFLEHSRFFIFHNNGDNIIYAASADWMKRNLSRRIEVAFPIYNKEIKRQIKGIIDLQLADNVKARNILLGGLIEFKNDNSETQIKSQDEIYNYLKNFGNL